MAEGNIHPDPSKPNGTEDFSTSGQPAAPEGSAHKVPEYVQAYLAALAAPLTPERLKREALCKTECDVLIPFVYGWQRAHGLPVGPHADVFPHGPIFPDMAARWPGWLAAAHDQEQLPELHVLYPNAARDGEWCRRRRELIEGYLAAHPKNRLFIKGDFIPGEIAGFGAEDYVELVGAAPWAAEAEARSAAADEKAAEQRRQEAVKAQIKQFKREQGIAEDEAETEEDGETNSGDTDEPTKKPAPGDGQGAKTSKPKGGWKRKAKAGAKPKPMLMVDDPKLRALIRPLHEAGMSQRDIATAVEPDYGRKVSQSLVNKIVAKLRGG